MVNKKISGALAVIAVFAISSQTGEKAKVVVDTAKVNADLKNDASEILTDRTIHENIFASIPNLSENIERDGKALNIDTAALAATYTSVTEGSRDSTYIDSTMTAAPSATVCYGNCYTNCHRACHSSRGWR